MTDRVPRTFHIELTDEIDITVDESARRLYQGYADDEIAVALACVDYDIPALGKLVKDVREV